MKVVHAVSGIKAESSGPSYSVPGLVRGLAEKGVDVELHSLEVPDGDLPYKAVTYSRNWNFIRSLGCSRGMKAYFQAIPPDVEIVHVNGMWMMPVLYPGLFKRGNGGYKLVSSPRGSLAKWSLRKSIIRKSVLWMMAQRRALEKTDMFHATCEKEYREIRQAGFRQPVAIIPIGMDSPGILLGRENVDHWGSPDKKKIVFLGRIHKVKGVDRLLKAWGYVVRKEKALAAGWEVLIAGPDCGGRAACDRVMADESLPRVSYVGELHGTKKYDFLAQADLYVLPSFTENFAITVAEALACKTPVIASKGSPWSGVGENECGWWVDNTPESIAVAILEAMRLASCGELKPMGIRGCEWIARDFTWAGVCAKMKSAYEWLLGRGDCPACVRID